MPFATPEALSSMTPTSPEDDGFEKISNLHRIVSVKLCFHLFGIVLSLDYNNYYILISM